MFHSRYSLLYTFSYICIGETEISPRRKTTSHTRYLNYRLIQVSNPIEMYASIIHSNFLYYLYSQNSIRQQRLNTETSFIIKYNPQPDMNSQLYTRDY